MGMNKALGNHPPSFVFNSFPGNVLNCFNYFSPKQSHPALLLGLRSEINPGPVIVSSTDINALISVHTGG